MDIAIVVAAHKEFPMPDDTIYLPIQVGAAGKDSVSGYVRDDTGRNLSAENFRYCELTGLYWAWKNLDVDYYGLVHYRRFFTNPHVLFRRKDSWHRILDRDHLERLLLQCDVILPHMRHYWIENLYDHYAHTHDESHLILTREIVAERCPEYLSSFDQVMNRTRAHMFNMMIMKKEKLDAYCEWLFPILEELVRRVDASEYDDYQARYPGRISELLLDVWITYQKQSYYELPLVIIGQVQWGRKVFSFLAAKLFGRKYKHSF